MSNPQTEAETGRQEPELCEGIQLLLQRMESHPKEFEIDSGKWGAAMRVVYERMMRNPKPNNVIPEPWLTQEEVYAVWGKYKEIKQQEFHEFVMKKLFDDGKDDRMDAYVLAQGKYDPTALQPGGIMPLPLQNTSTTSVPDRIKKFVGL